ncbi:MAG: hypothetical protein E7640_03910 [Ruminococcaceae bacterium]|nr:hypothetical protein [Oscillospiraceae bacterium]
MKKILLTILIISLICSVTAVFASCDEEHVHSFPENWVYDENSHWHECSDDLCIEISEKADHVWGEETVVEEATPESEGTSEKKCTVCGASESSSVTFAGISENKWNVMISESAFENYTLKYDGTMTVTAGEEENVSQMKSICKIASDKMEITVFAVSEDGLIVLPLDPLVLEGDLAETQKVQYTQLFFAVIQCYENFEYDAEQNVYKINETVTIEKDLAAISFSPTGENTEMIVPTVITIKDAVATVSDDGKLLSLVCDYKQDMEMNGGIVTEGITTWTFSDYGTTVIE